MPYFVKTLPPLLTAAWFFGGSALSLAQSTAFTYQGTLSANGTRANGSYDLTFAVFTNESGGLVATPPLTNLATSVSHGQFTVLLDYGPGTFNGANYWLEIGVRTNGDTDFSILSPREPITPVPYTIYAQSSQSSAVAESANAVAAANLIGVLTPAQLPNAMVTNNSIAVSLNGAFSGSFAGDAGAMTNLNASQLTAGVVPYSVLPSDVIRNGQSGPVAINGEGNGWPYALELTNNACLWLDTGGISQTADNYVQYIPDTQLGMFCMGMDVPFGEVIYGSGRNEWQALEVFMSEGNGMSVDADWPEGVKTFSVSCAGQVRLWNRLDALDNAGMIVFGQQDPTLYSNYFGIGVTQSNLLFGMTESNGTFLTTNILIDPSGNLSLYSPTNGDLTVNANVEISGSEFLTGSLSVLGTAQADTGVLSVAAGGDGLIAQFSSGTNGAVADIRTDGTVDATAFNTTSDRNKKEGFVPVDSRTVLEKVLQLPISEWNFKADAQTRHIGPMAQDFRSLFGVGSDEKHIATVDEEGVALAAIQGLSQRIEDQAKQISDQSAQIKSLQQTLVELQRAVSQLKRESAASGGGYSLASGGIHR